MKSLLLKKPFHSEFSFLFIRLLLRYNWHLMEHVRWACAVGWVTTRARLEATVSIRGVSTPRAPESLLVSPSPHPVPCKPPICSVAADWFPCFRIFYGITEDVLFFFFFPAFGFFHAAELFWDSCMLLHLSTLCSFFVAVQYFVWIYLPQFITHQLRNVWSFLVWGY